MAKPVSRFPAPDVLPGGCLYEPKWDGFRVAASVTDTETIWSRQDFEGLPHVLGFMDAVMIAEAFGLGESGSRYPGEWAARGQLLPTHAGVIGTRRVWKVEDVKAREAAIVKHLDRRQQLSEMAAAANETQ